MRNNLTRRTSIWTHFSCDRALNSFIKIRSAMAAPAFDLLPLSGSPRREGRQTGGGGGGLGSYPRRGRRVEHRIKDGGRVTRESREGRDGS